jgi:hypothetical protein
MNDERVKIEVYLSKWIKDSIKELADKRDQSVSTYVKELLMNHIEKQGGENEKSIQHKIP